jgi:hypothetical protein
MIPKNAQLHELPYYWREQIRKYRAEGKKLRTELREAQAELAALKAAQSK